MIGVVQTTLDGVESHGEFDIEPCVIRYAQLWAMGRKVSLMK